MKLIVGLGNPGKEYEKSRHNAGFMLVDAMQKKHEFTEFKEDKKFSALISKGLIKGTPLILVKPLTFMNLSGEAVQKIMQFYKIQTTEIIVAYDDLDLPIGSIRLRQKGTAGTHNGMKSIVGLIGINFPRLRLGIESRGNTSPKAQETVSFVLDSFNQNEKVELENMLKNAANALEIAINEGVERAMNTYNNAPNS